MPTSASLPARLSRRARRGISLIEALVAMAIMAFGMLGVIGMQSTLRASADLSKQRSEATRLAQEKIEAWRSFSVIPAPAPPASSVTSYASIAGTGAVENLSSFISNTTYTRTSTVTESSPPGHKTLVVDVSWPDRAGTTQNVRLFSVVAQVSPDLAATAVARPVGAGGTREPEGRRRGIPLQAKNFGDGTSGFVPPGGGGTGWRFDNVSGLITSVCSLLAPTVNNTTISATDFASCPTTQKYQLIWGFIRFDLTNPPTDASIRAANDDVPGGVTGVQAEVIQTAPAALAGTVNCLHGYADANLVETPPFKLAVFFCAVPADTTSTPVYAWSGTLQIRASSIAATPISAAGTYATDTSTGNRKVCRVRAAATYANAAEPLGNQNLFVIRAGDGTTPNICPTPPTFGHQPAP
ncbi:MAG: prepilin-type N-terminal cleavage/methylation domain-containing protein [Burkholderiales bacterium]|nr:prepilin-type N-terminal cleavage/methylation domain-containing protein [Burkholderiales bacterium]